MSALLTFELAEEVAVDEELVAPLGAVELLVPFDSTGEFALALELLLVFLVDMSFLVADYDEI